MNTLAMIRNLAVLAVLGWATVATATPTCNSPFCAVNIANCANCCEQYASCCRQRGGTPDTGTCQFIIQGSSNVCIGPECDGATTDGCTIVEG